MNVQKLKEWRIARGIQQKDLASTLGIGANTLSQYENGKREPDNNTLVQLADYFNVSVDYLLGRDEIKNPPQSDGAFDQIFSEKDELDISRRLDAMLSDLDKNNSALMFDGEPLDDESRELLISSLENSIRMAKIINKRKYTPKKYRKGSADDTNSDNGNG